MRANALRAWTDRHARRRRAWAHEIDESTRRLVLAMETGERLAVAELLRDELVRGWIPKRGDLEAALAVVRRDRTGGPCRP